MDSRKLFYDISFCNQACFGGNSLIRRWYLVYCVYAESH